MAKLKFTTKCPCGEEVGSDIKKPTWFENSFSKVTCDKCGSRFMLSCVRDKSRRERIFTTHFDLLFLSEMAEKIQGQRLKVKALAVQEKIFGPSADDRSVIEVDMDETA